MRQYKVIKRGYNVGEGVEYGEIYTLEQLGIPILTVNNFIKRGVLEVVEQTTPRTEEKPLVQEVSRPQETPRALAPKPEEKKGDK